MIYVIKDQERFVQMLDLFWNEEPDVYSLRGDKSKRRIKFRHAIAMAMLRELTQYYPLLVPLAVDGSASGPSDIELLGNLIHHIHLEDIEDLDVLK